MQGSDTSRLACFFKDLQSILWQCFTWKGRYCNASLLLSPLSLSPQPYLSSTSRASSFMYFCLSKRPFWGIIPFHVFSFSSFLKQILGIRLIPPFLESRAEPQEPSGSAGACAEPQIFLSNQCTLKASWTKRLVLFEDCNEAISSLCIL